MEADVELKIFDLRDRGTEMGAFAIRLEAESDLEADVMRRRGFSNGRFIVGTLGPSPIEATYDPFHWRTGDQGVRSNGTMFRAHELIVDRWDEFKSGDLIDLTDPRNAQA